MQTRFWRWMAPGFLVMAALLLTPGVAANDDLLPFDSLPQRLKACIACHGAQGKAASDGYYPRIAGKPAGYLYNQLVNFRDGKRRYPAMAYMVDRQSNAYLREMADYFASQHPPYPAPAPAEVSAAVLARGSELVNKGDTLRPACIACHGQALTGVLPATPALLGLPRDYLFAQLANWKSGARHAAQPDCMAQITARLSSDDIHAVASWLASQPVPPDSAPLAALPARPAIVCGSTRP